MKTTYLGKEHVRNFDEGAEVLQAIDFDYVVFRFRKLVDNIETFSGLNKDKVGVFVSSPLALIKAHHMGFRRTFVVDIIADITPVDVADAALVPLAALEETLALAKLSDMQERNKSLGSAVEALKTLIECIETRDAKKCVDILSRHAATLVRSTDALSNMLTLAGSVENTTALHKQLAQYKKECEKLREEIDAATANAGKATDTELAQLTASFNRMESELKDSVGQLSNLSEENKTLLGELDKHKKEIVEFKHLLQTEEEKSLQQYTDLSQTINKLQVQLEEQKTELDKSKTALTAVEGLKKQLEHDYRLRTEEYNEVVGKYNAAVKDLTNLREGFAEAQALLVRYKEAEDALNQSKVINSLKRQLQEAGSKLLSNDSVKKMMPVIGAKFALAASKIVLIKEIKTAPYMNAMITNLNQICLQKLYTEARKTFCIVVFDLMLDEFRVWKYRKRKFWINEHPLTDATNNMQVVVTNNFDIAFLKDTLRLNAFDYLLVVDRLGLRDLSVKHSSAVDFYMIDSVHDIEDFGLHGNNLIVYGDSKGVQPVTNIIPNGDLFDKVPDDRVFHLFKHKNVEKILQRAGIL